MKTPYPKPYRPKPGIYHNGQPCADHEYRLILAQRLAPDEARAARDEAMGRKEVAL